MIIGQIFLRALFGDIIMFFFNFRSLALFSGFSDFYLFKLILNNFERTFFAVISVLIFFTWGSLF